MLFPPLPEGGWPQQPPPLEPPPQPAARSQRQAALSRSRSRRQQSAAPEAEAEPEPAPAPRAPESAPAESVAEPSAPEPTPELARDQPALHEPKAEAAQPLAPARAPTGAAMATAAAGAASEALDPDADWRVALPAAGMRGLPGARLPGRPLPLPRASSFAANLGARRRGRCCHFASPRPTIKRGRCCQLCRSASPALLWTEIGNRCREVAVKSEGTAFVHSTNRTALATSCAASMLLIGTVLSKSWATSRNSRKSGTAL